MIVKERINIMKHIFTKIVIMLIGAALVAPLTAYEFSFSNHLPEPIKVRIQLKGVAEPWYETIIDAKEMYTFVFPWAFTPQASGKPWEYIRKAGFCLENIQMARTQKDTTGREILGVDNKPKFNPYNNVILRWAEGEAYRKCVEAGTAFADGLIQLAGQIAGAAMGVPSTGGLGSSGAGGLGIGSASSLLGGLSSLGSSSSAAPYPFSPNSPLKPQEPTEIQPLVEPSVGQEELP
jgi:hypothetical protein